MSSSPLMARRCRRVLLIVTLSTAWVASARSFHLDPVHGRLENSGSARSPWPSLEAVVAAQFIETRVPATHPPEPTTPLVPRNAGAPVQPGDTLILHNGHHGRFTLTGAYNLEAITVRAATGERPTLTRIALTAVAGWRLEGLTVRPDPGSAAQARPLIDIVSHGWQGRSRDVVIADCNAYSTADSTAWTLTDWNTRACNGIQVSGDDITVRGCRLLNVNFGISLTGDRGLVARNVVENFAGDGLRGLGNDLVFEYNLVKNCFDVNANHDDGFQSWSIHDDPPRERVVLRGNVIINYEDPNQPFRGPLQGIGCFDGPYVDWVIENNLIIVDHYHGISLYGAQGCRIVNNTVVDPQPGKPGPCWIGVFPHKNRTPSRDCLIRNNLCPRVSVSAGVTQDHNVLIQDPERLFVDPGAYDFHLRAEAPAIDRGTAALAPATDLDGTPRPWGPAVDAGAYEYRPPAP